jgi:hypothetical protein
MTLIDPKTLHWTLRSAGSDRKIAKPTQKNQFPTFPMQFPLGDCRPQRIFTAN